MALKINTEIRNDTGPLLQADMVKINDSKTLDTVIDEINDNILDRIISHPASTTISGENPFDLKDDVDQLKEDLEEVKQSTPNVYALDDDPDDDTSITLIVKKHGSTTQYALTAGDGIVISENNNISINRDYINSIIQDALNTGDVNVGAATENSRGTVISSSEKNGISVDENGSMVINEIGIEKISNTEGTVLVLSGGSAPLSS